MRPLGRKNVQAPASGTPAQEVPDAASWTSGHAFAARAATISLWAFLVVWPLVAALVVSAGAGSSSAAAPKSVSQIRSIQEQSTGAIATGFVGAWLSATSDNATELQRYTDTTSMTLPKQPWAYRDLSIVSIGNKARGGLIPVQIAAQVQETSIQGTTATTAWQSRYFAVTMEVTGNAVAPVGLPAVVAGPGKPKSTTNLEYPAKLDSTSSAAAAISSFLTAYLAATGDVSVYVTPNINITAINPAPFAAVKVDWISGDSTPPASPKDGNRLRVLIQAELVASNGQQVTANYALTLTARANRWEVTSIDRTPAAKPNTSSK